MTYEREFEFNEIEHDSGFGPETGDLIVVCSPIIEDTSFTASGLDGKPKTFGLVEDITGCQISSAVLYLVGNNGQDLGEVEFSGEEILELYPWLSTACTSRLIDLNN